MVYKTVKELMTALADAFRGRLNTNNKISSQEMPMKVHEVFNSGRDEGYNSGYNIGFDEGISRSDARYEEGLSEGITQGRKAEYDEFWDNYLPTETLNAAEYRFAGNGWNDKTFVPKRNIVIVGNAQYLFAASLITNIEKSLQDNGVILDTSRAKRLDYAFFYASCLVIPEISAIGVGTVALTRTFGFARRLHTIRKIVVNENVLFDRTFESCDALENIIIEGVIGQDGFNVQWSPLTHDSLISILTHLKDFSGTDTWKSITLGSDNLAKLTEEEKLIMYRKQWEYK